MKIWGHLVCLIVCTAVFVCTCVVPMCFQSVMDCGQVEKHGTLTERETGCKGSQTDFETGKEEKRHSRQRGAVLTDLMYIKDNEKLVLPLSNVPPASSSLF